MLCNVAGCRAFCVETTEAGVTGCGVTGCGATGCGATGCGVTGCGVTGCGATGCCATPEPDTVWDVGGIWAAKKWKYKEIEIK